MKRFFIGVFLLMMFLPFLISVKADEIDDINNAINSLKKDLSSKEVNYQSLSVKLNEIKSKIGNLEQEIVKKELEVKKGEQVLVYQQELLNERVKSYYKNVNKNSTLFFSVLVADDLSTSLRKIFYQKTIVDEDKKTIIKIVLYVKNLEEIKRQLEIEKSGLAKSKIEVDKQSQIIAKEIAGTRQEIATLTARQQQLIASRIAGLNLSRSASSAIQCVDDRNLDPGFGTGFAFYTYGIPHRVGMSQYGAKGRADSGQNYESILRTYYNYDSLQDMDARIRIDGHSPDYSLEDYVKRIYEMPADWNIEALKAQAIAARSFAMAYTNNGSGSICDSQDCQVFQDNEKGGRWNEAVDATKGKVMVSGGQPIKAWFASTFGGYTHTSAEVWGGNTSWTKNFADTSSAVGSFSELNERGWEKESKCFYTAQGSRPEYGKSAWLKPSEVADIANTLLLVKNDSSTGCFLYQTDKSPPSSDKTCPKTDNWSSDKVKSILNNPFNNITDVKITGVDFGGGRTTEIIIVENGHEERFGGDEFKNRFNLRAPGNISIVGPLFNIEKR
ncbi:MAG: SpoIID/LytB domain-containing protein [Patescibacteria group bacterium]